MKKSENHCTLLDSPFKRCNWLKVVSINRSLLTKEVPRFSADFTHHLSFGRPFNFLCHIVGSLGIKNIIATTPININSAIFNTDSDTYKETEKDTNKYTNNDMDTDMDTDLELDCNSFVRYPYGVIVPIAPYGLLETHHGNIAS
jgi:hypothetical protein